MSKKHEILEMALSLCSWFWMNREIFICKTYAHCSKTRFNPNVPQLTSSLQIIITHIYISHFIDFLKKITESILKNGHFYDFWAVLARFGIFGPFFSFFWAILNIFWTLNIMGDDHGSIWFFALFSFLAVFGFLARFLDFGFSGDLGLFWEC